MLLRLDVDDSAALSFLRILCAIDRMLRACQPLLTAVEGSSFLQILLDSIALEGLLHNAEDVRGLVTFGLLVVLDVLG